MSANPHANGGELLRDLVLPDFRDYARRRSGPGHDVERGDARARRVPPRRRRAEPRQLPHLRPRRDGVEPARRRFRGHRPGLGGRDTADGRGPRARRSRPRDPLRAPLPGLARGLPAHRPSRRLQLLRGVHPHRRLDVQPAREVAEGHARHPVAAADRVAQLPPELPRLAPGPQRLLAPGSRLHRPRREQEGRDHPRLPAAGREHAPLRRRSLPAQQELRQRRRRRQAARAQLPVDGRGDRPLHARPRDLGVGVERRRRRARRRAGLLRRRPDARDARRRRDPARAPAGV